MSELHADVQAFRQYIRAERGLADNTLQAYGRDLDRFAMWVATGGLADHLYPTLRELSNYVSFLRDQEQFAAPSVARNHVAVKIFYRFLRLEVRTAQTTVDLLASPALWQRIPQVLSHEQVNKLLDAPLPADRYYQRDKAMLETLSATGCGATEVIGLRLADLQ